MTAKALVTFALFAYNQADFILEAVQAALAQTYSPLEVILSDDASSDATFDIMKAAAEAYRGPHSVVLRRNAQNLGLATHLETVLRSSRGALIVVAAGDDVSRPERTSCLAQEWLASGRQAACLFSNAQTMDKSGHTQGLWCVAGTPACATSLERALADKSCWVYGFSAAYDRAVVDRFLPMEPTIIQEDSVLPFRALIVGQIRYVDRCLVDYRLHDRSVSWVAPGHGGRSRSVLEKRVADNRSAIVETWIRDLHTAKRDDLVERFHLRREKVDAEVEASTFDVSKIRALQRIGFAWTHGMTTGRAWALVKKRVLQRIIPRRIPRRAPPSGSPSP